MAARGVQLPQKMVLTIPIAPRKNLQPLPCQAKMVCHAPLSLCNFLAHSTLIRSVCVPAMRNDSALPAPGYHVSQVRFEFRNQVIDGAKNGALINYSIDSMILQRSLIQNHSKPSVTKKKSENKGKYQNKNYIRLKFLKLLLPDPIVRTPAIDQDYLKPYWKFLEVINMIITYKFLKDFQCDIFIHHFYLLMLNDITTYHLH